MQSGTLENDTQGKSLRGYHFCHTSEVRFSLHDESVIIIDNNFQYFFHQKSQSHIISILPSKITTKNQQNPSLHSSQRQNLNFRLDIYKRKDKNLYLQTPRLIYNVQYSFNNTFTPPEHMSNAYVSLHHIIPKQETPQNIMLSLYSKLSLEEEPQKVHDLANEIFFFIEQVDEDVLEASLQLITKLFSKGYANLIAESTGVINKIMKHFVLLFKMHEQHETKELKYRKLFVLSVIAELIRQEPKCLVPFSREFLFKVFEIEAESLELSSQKNQLLAILGAIFGNSSKQAKLIKEFKLAKQFKMAILNNYSCIEEPSTFRLFNQAILQAQIRRASFFTLCELERYKIKAMLLKTLPENQTGHLNQYLERIFPRSKENRGRTN